MSSNRGNGKTKGNGFLLSTATVDNTSANSHHGPPPPAPPMDRPLCLWSLDSRPYHKLEKASGSNLASEPHTRLGYTRYGPLLGPPFALILRGEGRGRGEAQLKGAAEVKRMWEEGAGGAASD